jgi:L-ribulose-5-phosphate 3-epimerase
MKLAVSSYSFHRFGHGPEENVPPDFSALIDACARMGIDGLELLGVHFPSREPSFLYPLKQRAFRNGVALVAVSAHHNFVTPGREKRQGEIEKLCSWVDVAYELGAPAVRAFGGRWATRPKFAEFMAARGEEPPLEGYTEDDGYAWTAEAFRIAAEYAGTRGVTLVLENHWGFTGTAEGVLRILGDVDSPWLKVVLDTGNFNFCSDPYAEMEALAPYTAMVHAKTYTGGGIYYTADLDYGRIARLLSEAGFQGYVSLEFEGRAHPDQGIPESLALLRESFGSESPAEHAEGRGRE